MAPSKSSASTRSGKARGDVLAGARVDAPDERARRRRGRRRPGGGCRPISIRPRKSAGSSLPKSSSSRGWDSIGGRNGAGLPDSGFGPRPRPRRTGPRRAARARARSARPRRARRPPSCATAVLASRAETPMRSSRVMSFRSAQRPGLVERVEPAGERRRQIALAGGRPRPSTTSVRVGTCGGGLLWPCGRLDPAGDRGGSPEPSLLETACGSSRRGAGCRPASAPTVSGEVAHIVVGHPEQHRIDPLLHEAADQVRLRLP